MPRRFALGNEQDLVQAERDIRARIGDSELDFAAMAAVSNIYRAANAIRHHMEQQVLADEDLSWAAFTVLFVLWVLISAIVLVVRASRAETRTAAAAT